MTHISVTALLMTASLFQVNVSFKGDFHRVGHAAICTGRFSSHYHSHHICDGQEVPHAVFPFLMYKHK